MYRAVWTPYIGNQLDCISNSGTIEDPSLLQFRKTVKRLVMCSLSTEKDLYVAITYVVKLV